MAQPVVPGEVQPAELRAAGGAERGGDAQGAQGADGRRGRGPYHHVTVSPQPHPLLSRKRYNIPTYPSKKCSREADKWTSVRPWWAAATARRRTAAPWRGAAPSPRVDRAWFQRWKPKYDEPLSNFAFNFNLRRYTAALGKSLDLGSLRQAGGSTRLLLTST